MTDAIGASPSNSISVTGKSGAGQLDRTESGGRDGKDFAATFDEVRQKNQTARAAEAAEAANDRPEAAKDEPEAANADVEAANAAGQGTGTAAEEHQAVGDRVEIDPAATDPAAAAMAQQLMPLAPPVTTPPSEAAATDVDPASAVAAAVAPRAAAVATAAALQASGVTSSPIRPEVRAAVHPTGLDAAQPATDNAAAPQAGAEASTTPLKAGALKPGGDRPAGGNAESRLEQAALGAAAGEPAKDALPEAQDKTGATPGAEQALAAASGRERDARAEVVRLDTRLPLHSPRFAEGFSQQVVVLTQHGIQQAQMTLNPPDLGPVDVRITVNQDQATVQIAAASGAAREVIQEALPKLRDLMEQSGVRLNDAGVFAQLPQREHPAGYAQRQTWLMDAPGGRRREEAALGQPMERGRRVGLIDAYA